MTTRRRTCSIVALALWLSVAPLCRADNPFPVRRESPDPELVAKQIRTMVARLVSGGNVALPEASEHTDAFHYQIVRGYAMMQALPYLASFSCIRNDGSVKSIAADGNFEAARKFAESTLAEIQKKGHTLRLSDNSIDGVSAELVRRELLGTVEGLQRTNYAVPLVLAFLDSAYTGGLDLKIDGFSASRDRRARAGERPSAEGRRAVVRLTSLVLARGRGDFGTDETKPKQRMLWNYDDCASAAADMSVTGLAPLALRAAANLELLNYEKEAFEFPFADNGSALSRDVFLARLSDVLVHMVVTLAEAGANHSSASEDTADWDARKDGGPNAPVDVRRYRTDPVNHPSGLPIRRVVGISDPLKLPVDPPNSPEATLFYYSAGIDKDANSGAYHCANAAYATTTCANLLVALLEKSTGATLGKACPIKPVASTPKTWTVTLSAGEYQLKLADSHRYTRLVVQKAGADLRLDDRIARMFNMIVRLVAQAPGGAGPAAYYTLRTEPQKYLGDDGHKDWMGLHWFSVSKACLCTSQHAFDLGPWPWYDSLIDEVVVPGASNFAVKQGTLDFMIITTTRSFRSIFSREK